MYRFRPAVVLHVGSARVTAHAERSADPVTIARVTDLMAKKYWYTWLYVWLARLLGWQVSSAAFRGRLETAYWNIGDRTQRAAGVSEQVRRWKAAWESRAPARVVALYAPNADARPFGLLGAGNRCYSPA